MNTMGIAVLAAGVVAASAWAGPGTVVVATDPTLGVNFRIGGQARVIPTYEGTWDFGLADNFGISGLRSHVNEAGILSRDYVRTEDRLYFNVNHGDDWDFYTALEFDTAFTQRRTDRLSNLEKGIFDDFGIERLQASAKLPWLASRLHMGWDINPSADIDGGGFVYVDDDPAIWLSGKAGSFGWKVAYVLKNEAHFIPTDRLNSATAVPLSAYENNRASRRLWSSRLDYTLREGATLSAIYVVNDSRLRGQPPATGINALYAVTHYPGLLFSGNFAGFKPIVEVAGSVGSVTYPGLASASADYFGNDIQGRTFAIRSFGAFADLAYDLGPRVGFKLEPHIGMYWLQGDNNPADDTLNGFTPAVSNTRFPPRFAGEMTILMDTNAVYGSTLYGLVPEMWGNQGANLTNGGGLFNNSRSDSPGLTLVGGGVDTEPIKAKLRYRTNVYGLIYNAPFLVGAVTDPNNASVLGILARDTGTKRVVDSRFFGVAWDNELSYFINSTVTAKLQFSFLFPGPAAQQIVGALADQGTGENADLGGGVSMERAAAVQATTIKRIAAELVWSF